MFAKIFALFALVAVALAAPSPKPAPSPQFLTYSTGLDYGVYPAAGYSSVYSPYAAAAPVAYSAYSAYPAGAYYLR